MGPGRNCHSYGSRFPYPTSIPLAGTHSDAAFDCACRNSPDRFFTRELARVSRLANSVRPDGNRITFDIFAAAMADIRKLLPSLAWSRVGLLSSVVYMAGEC